MIGVRVFLGGGFRKPNGWGKEDVGMMDRVSQILGVQWAFG